MDIAYRYPPTEDERMAALSPSADVVRALEAIQRAEIQIRAVRRGLEHQIAAGANMTRDPTREQLHAFDIRAAWRRGYVEGFQVAMLAMSEHCPPERWQELAAWVQDQLIRWRFGRIDADTRPPEAPGTSEPTTDTNP